MLAGTPGRAQTVLSASRMDLSPSERMRGWAASQGSWPGAWARRKCDPSQCPQDLGIQSLCRGERGSVTHVGPHPSWGSPRAAVSAAPGGPSSPAVVLRVEAALLCRASGCLGMLQCGQLWTWYRDSSGLSDAPPTVDGTLNLAQACTVEATQTLQALLS